MRRFKSNDGAAAAEDSLVLIQDTEHCDWFLSMTTPTLSSHWLISVVSRF